MEKINVLVMGVGGNVSQGILKALIASSLNVNIVGACIEANSLGLYMSDTAYISPLASSDEFIPWLINVCNKEKIQMILTGVEEIVMTIAENYEHISVETGAISVFSPYEKLLIGQDKYATCEWLKDNGCNYPLYCKLDEAENLKELVKAVGFPLIVKPRRGKGSKGVVVVKNQVDLDKLQGLSDCVVQECIGNEHSEYTVGCYCNKFGELIDVIIMHRELKYGTTFKATIVDNEQIHSEVVKICSAFKPVGPLNVQLRLDGNGRPVCFELNVRFSGTTPIRAHFGYNDVEGMIREYVLNEDIQGRFSVSKGTAYRYFEEIYIDEHMKEQLKKNKMIEKVNMYSNRATGYGR